MKTSTFFMKNSKQNSNTKKNNQNKLVSKIWLLSLIFIIGVGNIGWGQATLPFTNIATTSGNSTMPTGFSQSGLGTAYASAATPWKFDTQGDYVICNFNSTPGTLTFKLTNNGLTGSYQYDVLQSTDGVSYTSLQSSISITGTQTFTIAAISSTTRYIKWIYTTKATGNIGLGTIGLTAGATPKTVTFNSNTGAAWTSLNFFHFSWFYTCFLNRTTFCHFFN